MKSNQPKSSAGRPQTERPDPPQDHLGYLLKRLQHAIRQSIDEALRHQGVQLTFAHVVTLFGISHEPGTSGAQIAKRAMVTAQTINTILHRLEKEGSAERRPHPDNRRVDCWYITEAGRARMHQAKAAADPVWASMLAPLSEVEAGQLRGLLKRCIEGLERNRVASDSNEDFPFVPPRTRRARVTPKKQTTEGKVK
jgi:DNA-binding MarR family transcriptional regulator